MTKRKSEIIAAKLDKAFPDCLKTAFQKKFDIEIESYYSLFATRFITIHMNQKVFTVKELAFLAAYSDGYEKAMLIVSEM